LLLPYSDLRRVEVLLIAAQLVFADKNRGKVMKAEWVKSFVVCFAAFVASQQASAFCTVFTGGLCGAACQGRSEDITLELVQSADDDEKVCALSMAQDVNILSILLNRGVDVNSRTKHKYSGMPSGNTALFTIISRNRLDLFQYLLDHGFNVNVQDNAKMTPLMYAAWDSRKEMVEGLLKAGAQPNVKGRFGETALCYAKGNILFFRDDEIISMLEKSGGVCDK
jgi:hypothetical protein